jgi:outer membrane protein assembly factor BamB
VVAGGRVFLHEKVKDKTVEDVFALDAKTGKELWRTEYQRDAFNSPYGNGPRATPAVVGDRVYSFGITGVLTCFDAVKGSQVWQVDTLKKFEAKNLFFGAACSPLVEGNNVLVNVGGKGASIVAFNKDKGDVAWKSLDDGASYSSPISFGEGKNRQVVFLTARGVASLDPSNGSLFWQFPLVDKLSITYGSAGLRLEVKKDTTQPSFMEAWKNPALTCYFSTPVAVGDSIYLVTGANPLAIKKPEATLRCIDAKTGKELWNRPKVGTYHAALLRTGDNKLLLLDDRGSLILVEPNAKEYRELARSKVCGFTWAHPALSDGRLYIRDNNEVICLQLGE